MKWTSKMSRPKVEYVVDDESSEDEVEVIPYVKPAPVVIDLLESASDQEMPEEPLKTPRKKKKRKSTTVPGSSNDVASHDKPSTSCSIQTITDECRESPPGQVVETGLRAEHVSGSNYVAGGSTTSSPIRTSVPQQVSLLESGLNSLDFEGCDNAQSNEGEIMIDAIMTGTPSTSKEKRSKSKEKKTRGEGKSRPRRISATQRTNEEIVNFLTTLGIEMEPSAFDSPKKRRQSRKRQQSDLTQEINPDAHSSTNLTDGFPLSGDQVEEVQVPSILSTAVGSFVSVTQENTGRRKGKRQRQAIIGDISDYQISFKKGDLDSVNTNFQSNVVLPAESNSNAKNFFNASSNKKVVNSQQVSHYISVIDAVARGDGVLNPSTSTSNTAVLRDRLQINDKRHDKVAERIQISKITDNQSMSYNNDSSSITPGSSSSFHEYESPLSGLSLDTSKPVVNGIRSEKENSNSADASFKIQSSTSQGCTVNQDVAVKSVCGSGDEYKRTSNDLTISDDVPPPKRSILTSDQTLIEGDSNVQKDQNSSLIGLEIESKSKADSPKVRFLPYFPSTWTEEMKKFYDCSRTKASEYELDRMWEKMTDVKSKWRSPMDLMPPPKVKNRHIRCDNCKQVGHLARTCTEKRKVPCCHMCGQEGHTSDRHSRRPCPETRCLNCGRSQNQYSQRCPGCLLRHNPGRCDSCNVVGHGRAVCPENWRRYHSVTSVQDYEMAKSFFENQRKELPKHDGTTPKELYKAKPSMFCCNCGRKGHSYYDCYDNRFNPYHRNKPFVIRELPALPVSNKTNNATIPISYDARTGRTVVMNTESPEIAVETIQVKITNDLATTSSDLPVNACKQNKGCSNKLRSTEQCVQSILMTQAHQKLLKAQEHGVLKSFEERHSVQISVIDEGNKIHICGTNAIQAEKDLYRFLWTKESTRISSSPNNNSNNVNSENLQQHEEALKRNVDISSTSNQIKASQQELTMVNTTSSTTELLGSALFDNEDTLKTASEDDDDDCCVIAEVTAGDSWQTRTSEHTKKSAIAALANEMKSSTTFKTTPDQTSRKNELDSLPVIPKTAYFIDDSPPPPCHIYTPFESASERHPSKRRLNDVGGSNYDSPPSSPKRGNRLGTINYTTVQNESFVENNAMMDVDVTFNSVDLAIRETLSNKKPPGSSSAKKGVRERIESLEKNVEKDDITSQPKVPTEGSSSVSNSKISSNIEVITLDDDKSDTDDIEAIQSNPENGKKVTLLQSEWEIVTSESMKKENVINRICSKFDVDMIVSKDTSCITITNGTEETRQIAKDNIVYWLEYKSLNTSSEFQMLPSGSGRVLPNIEVEDSNRKRNLIHTPPGAWTPKVKKRKRAQRSPSRTYQAFIASLKNSRNTEQTSANSVNQFVRAFNNQTPLMGIEASHPWSPGFNKKNHRVSHYLTNTCDGIATPSPKKKKGKNRNMPGSTSNCNPHKPRYYQQL